MGIGSSLFGPTLGTAQSTTSHERGGPRRHGTEDMAVLGLPTKHDGRHSMAHLSRPCTTQNRPVRPEDATARGRARDTWEAVAVAIVVAGSSPPTPAPTRSSRREKAKAAESTCASARCYPMPRRCRGNTRPPHGSHPMKHEATTATNVTHAVTTL